MKPLRVLHLGKFYPPVRGGMETVLQTLCAGQHEAIQPQALVMNRARKTMHEVVDGVQVTRVASWVTVGAVAVAPGLPLVARAHRRRRHRPSRAQPDGAPRVLHRPAGGAARRLVPQRGRSSRLALPDLLPAAAGVRPRPRRTHRRRFPTHDLGSGARDASPKSAPSSPSGWSRTAIWRAQRLQSRPGHCGNEALGRSCSSSGVWWHTKVSTS